MGQDDQRVRRIKQYVLARLREELSNAPRGAQAKLAKRLGVSGAHLSNMLSSTPSRQPGEDFRRKVSTHWGVTYAQLESLALGEEAPESGSKPMGSYGEVPPNLTAVIADYNWMHELPHELRVVVREQARQHFAYARCDLSRDEWHLIITGLEREALALLAHRAQHPRDRDGVDDDGIDNENEGEPASANTGMRPPAPGRARTKRSR